MKYVSVKAMKEAYVNYTGDQEEMNKLYDSLHVVACAGLIGSNVWAKFSEDVAGWYYDDEFGAVVDDRTDEVIWCYNPHKEYKATR